MSHALDNVIDRIIRQSKTASAEPAALPKSTGQLLRKLASVLRETPDATVSYADVSRVKEQLYGS